MTKDVNLDPKKPRKDNYDLSLVRIPIDETQDTSSVAKYIKDTTAHVDVESVFENDEYFGDTKDNSVDGESSNAAYVKEVCDKLKSSEEFSYFYTKYIDEAEKPVATSAYNCAVLAYEKGDQKLVQKALSKSVNTDISSIKQYSYMLLGQSYMLSGETQKANMAFEQASMIDADKEVQESAAYNKAVLVHETSYSPWGDEVIQFENFLNTYPNSKYSDNIR